MSIYEKKRTAAESLVSESEIEALGADGAEADSVKELEEMRQGFRDRMKNENKRRMAATDSEFWFAVCFKTREEKDEFLKRWKLFRHGDKYLSGAVVNTVLENLTKTVE